MARSDTNVTITPFWKGVAVGVGLVFAWRYRGLVLGLLRRLWHGGGLSGAIDAVKLAAATGIEMPSSDPAIAFRQMRRYAFAAMQDKSPIVGLTHASYALIGLDILEEAVGRDKLAAVGVDAEKARVVITKLQDMHAKALEACDPYLTQALMVEHGDGMESSGPSFAGYGAPTGA